MSKEITNIPYTYLIGWSKYNKFYYGVRTAKNCNPSDLWITYFTSSKYVNEFYKKFGQPDIIQIRRIFLTKESALLWEYKVIKRMKLIFSDIWLNKGLTGKKFNNIDFHNSMTELEKKIYSEKCSKSAKARFAKMTQEEKDDYAEKHRQIALIPENRAKNSKAIQSYWDNISNEAKQEFIATCTESTRKSKEKRQLGLKKYNDNLSVEEKEQRRQKCIEVENRPDKRAKREALKDNEDYIQNLSVKAKERYANTEYKENWLKVQQSEEVRLEKSIKTKAAYEKKEVKDAHKKAVTTKEHREKCSNSAKEKFNNPEFRKLFDARMQSEEYKKSQSDKMKARCADPAYIKLMQERAARGVITRRKNKELKNLQV